MKRGHVAVVFLVISLALGLFLPQAALARNYTVSQLDNEATFGNDTLMALNNLGQIAYYHYMCPVFDNTGKWLYDELGQYLCYQNGRATALNIPYTAPSPQDYDVQGEQILFNDRGQMAYWQAHLVGSLYQTDLFFQDGNHAPQLLATNHNGWNVQLNQQGQVAWWGNDANGVMQVYLFSNGQIKQITSYTKDGADGFGGNLVSLNNQGQVMWTQFHVDNSGYTPVYTYSLMLYQNGVTSVFWSAPLGHVIGWFQINDRGRAVWEDRWTVGDITTYSNLLLNDGVQVKQITQNINVVPVYLQINAQGQVMWVQQPADGGAYNIFLYDGNNITQITSYSGYYPTVDVNENQSNGYPFLSTNYAPRLNNQGDIMWVAESVSGSIFDYTVNVYHAGVTTTLDHFSADGSIIEAGMLAQFNDAGQVAWMRWHGDDYEIYLATPVKGLACLNLLMD